MFKDRIDAGKQLAVKLLKYRHFSPLVIALPRGGVVTGFSVAKALHSPLEIINVRKIGAPHNPELGIGAVAEGGAFYLDKEMKEIFQITERDLQRVKEEESDEVERRKQLFRMGKTLPLMTNKTVILVDDGLATGVTARAALLSLKKLHPKRIILAVPVCSEDTALALRPFVDTIVCLDLEEHLDSIGRYYQDFRQVTDDEVIALLDKVNENHKERESKESHFSHKIVW